MFLLVTVNSALSSATPFPGFQIRQLSDISSGPTQGRSLMTSDPVRYLDHMILLSKLVNEIGPEDMGVCELDTFDHAPVLCHGALTMDHVIVDGGRLSGLVGWSKCDFAPEVSDRLSYYFAQPVSYPRSQWYDFLAGRGLCTSPLRQCTRCQ